MVLVTLMSTSVYLEQHLQHSYVFRVLHASWAALGRWFRNVRYVDGIDRTGSLFRTIRRQAARDDDWACVPPDVDPLQLFDKIYYTKGGGLSDDRPVVMYSQRRIYWRRADYYDMQQNSIRVVPATTDLHDNDLIALLRTRQRIAAFLMLYKESEELAAAQAGVHSRPLGRTTMDSVRIAVASRNPATVAAANATAAAFQHSQTPVMLASLRAEQLSLLHESIRHMKQSLLLDRHHSKPEQPVPTLTVGSSNFGGNIEVDSHQFRYIISAAGETSAWTRELSGRLAHAVAVIDQHHRGAPKHAADQTHFPLRHSDEHHQRGSQASNGRASLPRNIKRNSDSMRITDYATHTQQTSSGFQKFGASQRRSIGLGVKVRPKSLVDEIKQSTRRKSYANCTEHLSVSFQ